MVFRLVYIWFFQSSSSPVSLSYKCVHNCRLSHIFNHPVQMSDTSSDDDTNSLDYDVHRSARMHVPNVIPMPVHTQLSLETVERETIMMAVFLH